MLLSLRFTQKFETNQTRDRKSQIPNFFLFSISPSLRAKVYFTSPSSAFSEIKRRRIRRQVGARKSSSFSRALFYDAQTYFSNEEQNFSNGIIYCPQAGGSLLLVIYELSLRICRHLFAQNQKKLVEPKDSLSLFQAIQYN